MSIGAVCRAESRFPRLQTAVSVRSCYECYSSHWRFGRESRGPFLHSAPRAPAARRRGRGGGDQRPGHGPGAGRHGAARRPGPATPTMRAPKCRGIVSRQRHSTQINTRNIRGETDTLDAYKNTLHKITETQTRVKRGRYTDWTDRRASVRALNRDWGPSGASRVRGRTCPSPPCSPPRRPRTRP